MLPRSIQLNNEDLFGVVRFSVDKCLSCHLVVILGIEYTGERKARHKVSIKFKVIAVFFFFQMLKVWIVLVVRLSSYQ